MFGQPAASTGSFGESERRNGARAKDELNNTSSLFAENSPTGFGQTAQQQQKPQQGGIGLFGTPATAATGANLFGAPSNNANTNINTATSGLFGASTPAATSGGSLFGGGGGATTNAFGTPAQGNAFGAAAGGGAGGGSSLFGGAAPATTGSSGRGLFGAGPAGGSLFGSTTPAPATGGLFGASTGNAPKTNAFGGFGQTPTASTGGGFGGFGQTNNASTNSGFGGFGQTNTTATTGFGGFGGMNQQQQQPQHMMQQQRPITILDKIREIQGYWNPTSPSCQFRHYFYNMVHPNEVQKYGCPPNHDPNLYNQAIQDNPDPTCMVPVLAVGFEDLKKRVSEQDAMSDMHKAKLEELAERLNAIERKHYLETTVKLEEYKRRHVELSQRVLSMMKTVEILRNKGYPIRSEEEALRARLEAMNTQLKKPAHFRGRVQELEAALRMIKDARRMESAGSLGAAAAGGAGGLGREGVVEMSEEQIRLIAEALGSTQQGLKNLSELVEEDGKDIEVISRGYSESIYQRR
ncbi:nucleoporin complex subunit 54-domain-containing protein [Chytriomyces sp. MP71]|nr:nucleoporin complex subunit 54-domain-containing protein [Chytriomyces sp. MP71]